MSTKRAGLLWLVLVNGGIGAALGQNAVSEAYVSESSSAVQARPEGFVGPMPSTSLDPQQTALGVRRVPPVANRYDKYILPGQRAQKLSSTDKILMGFRDSATPVAALGWFASGTYSEITDGPPNYQADGKAYIERIGAAAARGASEEIFTTSLFSTMLHEDPRYYKRGKGHNTAYRALYAASRTFITRSDGGTPTPNLARLLGNLGGTSLTQAYYPSQNRGFNDLARTYGESLAGTSLSLVFSEFLSDALAVMHLQKIKFITQ